MQTTLVAAATMNLQITLGRIFGGKGKPVSIIDLNPYIHRSQMQQLMKEFGERMVAIAQLPVEERREARAELERQMLEHKARLQGAE